MEEKRQQCDIIIVGAGASGLSLFWHLFGMGGESYDVLIIDKNIKQKNDRTWCYWAEKPLSVFPDSRRSWSQLSFHGPGNEQIHHLDDLTYFCVQSGDFYREMHVALAQNEQATFLQAEVDTIQSIGEKAVVYTADGGRYEASWVFDSRPTVVDPGDFPAASTWQHFLGLEISVDQAVFEPQRVTLMDFQAVDHEDICFGYVLPFSPRRALVEITLFSNKLPDRGHYLTLLKQYVKNRWGIESYTIHEEEKGRIPMTSFRFPRRPQARVMRIGTVGGATRASTGYTFANIQRDCEAIVHSLRTKGHPFHGEVQSARSRFYDRLLLDVIHHQPERVPAILERLFRLNHASKVLKFLDGQTTIREEIPMVLRLPWAPFLKALVRQYAGFLLPGIKRESVSDTLTYPKAPA